MKHTIIPSTSCILFSVFSFSCGSSSTYVDPSGGEGIVNTTVINIQDFQTAAHDLVQKMLVHPEFAQYTTANKAQIHLSDFLNDTGRDFPPEFLLADVRRQLLSSGKFKISRIRGRSGTDDYARQMIELRQLETGKIIDKLPNYVLSGETTELRVRAGRTTQSSFRFTLRATDLEGNAAFEDFKDITKQGTKSAIGF